jgi:NH3-dependent NAD+ synthetase
MDRRLVSLIEWIRGTTTAARGLLVPVSGGSDSALCFWLCCQARPSQVVGVHAGTNLRSREWFETCGRVDFVREPDAGPDDKDVARWATMLTLSRSRGMWLVGTRNGTEEALGTYSLASRLAGFLPLMGLWKSEILELCTAVAVPSEVTASSLRADPACGRPAELAEIPLGRIDLFLQIKEGAVPEHRMGELLEAEVRYLERIYQGNRFKKLLPTCAPRFSP